LAPSFNTENVNTQLHPTFQLLNATDRSEKLRIRCGNRSNRCIKQAAHYNAGGFGSKFEMQTMEDFLKRDAQIVQHHLSDALRDHSKLVDTVVAWTALMRSAYSRGRTYGGMDYDAMLVGVCDIDDETIRAMKNGLNLMLAGDRCIFCDPWRSFVQLGITAALFEKQLVNKQS
jgi:hypothetical protein